MSSTANATTTTFHINLIYLPVDQRNKLCAILDQNDNLWMGLGAFMQFSEFEILVREKSF